jgi:hypothetical protein
MSLGWVIVRQFHRLKKLRGLSPLVNYTDRVTTDFQRSYCQRLGMGCDVVSVTNRYGRNLGFLDRSSYFFL